MMLDGEPPISTTRDQRFCVQNPSVLRPRHWSHTMSEAAPPETLQLPAGTVTFLLTDIEGSTALWQEAPEEMAMAVARHHELLEEVVAAHAGVRPEEQGEGDSIVAAFSRASDAVHAALHAQRCLQAEQWPTPRPIRVRMAVHTGEPRLRGGANYVGMAVIRTARRWAASTRDFGEWRVPRIVCRRRSRKTTDVV